MVICHLELFFDNFPEVLDIWSDVAHDTVHIGNVCGIDLLVPGSKVDP